MKFLFCSVATPGFLFPSLAVAQALVRFGHEVAFVTDVSQASVVEEAGLRRIPRGTKDGHSFEIQTWFYPLPIAIQVKHIEHALRSFSADVLVAQPLTIGPYIVRERLGMPLAVLGMASPLWPTDPELSGRQPSSRTETRRLGRHAEMMRIYNEARKLFRLAPGNEDFVDSPLLGDLYLAQTVPELWSARESLADRIRPVGSCLWEPTAAYQEVDDWLAADTSAKPLIYVQLGRNFEKTNPTQTLFPHLREDRFRVAFSMGRCDSELETLPESFLVHDHVPQGRILPHADIMIFGGNSTAMLGAMTHGLPSLILFGDGEQPDIAELCTAAGSAIALPVTGVTGAEIQDGIRRLMDEEHFRLRAREIQTAFGRYEGPRTAADHLVALAEKSYSSSDMELHRATG
jgi:UDP:flavonoid glycosyltransferase YjiC (YdhE family)